MYSYNLIKFFFSNCLASSAVPLFFTFAAYLQAKKNYSYCTLINKRTKSILIPYILWISIYMLYAILGKILILKFYPSAFTDTYKSIKEWSFLDYFTNIIGYGKNLGIAETNNPLVAGQFWFLRDLMILIIISPIIQLFIKYIPISFFIIVFVITSLDINLYFLSNVALAYYTFGFYWGSYDFSIFDKIDQIKWREVFILFFITSLIKYKFLTNNSFISALMIIFSAILLLKLSGIIIKNEILYNKLKFLSEYSFFLYAVHIPILFPLLKEIWLICFSMSNSFFCIIEYILLSFITIITGTLLGVILKKILPIIFGLLNGNRITPTQLEYKHIE